MMPEHARSPDAAPPPATASDQPATHRQPGPPAIPSEQLMRGQRSITIVHRGVTYQLHATRQGKLILTK